MYKIISILLVLILFAGCDSAEKDEFLLFMPENSPILETAAAFEYRLDDELGGVVITNYTGSRNNIIIPGEIDGKPVIGIGNEGVAHDVEDYIEEILGEDLVRVITYSVFQKPMYSIELPDGLLIVGDGVFAQNRTLKRVVVPDSVVYIGRGAFFECDALEAVTLPFDVRGIKNAGLAASVKLYTAIPDGVTEIEDFQFSMWRWLYSVNIPGSVTKIGANAFMGCVNLTDITIPDSVTSIGRQAFDGCSSLESIVIPDSVAEIGQELFKNCKSLKNVTLPAGMTAIPSLMFDSNTSLMSITIPDGVTKIGVWAFAGCTALVDVYIPDSVVEIENRAFARCTSLSQESRQKILQINPNAEF